MHIHAFADLEVVGRRERGGGIAIDRIGDRSAIEAGEESLPRVAEQRARIGKYGPLDSEFARNAPDRKLQFVGRAEIGSAAKRVVLDVAVQVTRDDALGRKATHELRAKIEVVVDLEGVVAPAMDIAALELQETDHVLIDLIVVFG